VLFAAADTTGPAPTLCYQCFLDAARKKVHLPCKVSLTLGGCYSGSCKDLCGCAVLCIWVGCALAPPRKVGCLFLADSSPFDLFLLLLHGQSRVLEVLRSSSTCTALPAAIAYADRVLAPSSPQPLATAELTFYECQIGVVLGQADPAPQWVSVLVCQVNYMRENHNNALVHQQLLPFGGNQPRMGSGKSQPSWLVLPNPGQCLLRVLQCCAADHPRSLFSTAGTHSRLHQAAMLALRSITSVVKTEYQTDSLPLFFLVQPQPAH
jgi:hypothetical protein